ncbi:RICIN domain-containing protein [Nonomuraea sp. NPDC003560]|uniref:RICIN domain-containing protein n=1 Tax=Nonomuraea sp. NPDC003560 TaxID=3364341 RepID=UPI0036894147
MVRPAAAMMSVLLLSLSSPGGTPAAWGASASPTSVTAPATAEDPPWAGPGASGPDLSHGNRTAPPAGLPDWSRAGYRGGQELPEGDAELTDDASCRISPEELASSYGVTADDGTDDTAGLQKAIDHIKNDCSPNANFNRLSLIELPAGRIDITRQIYVDAGFLIVRGKGSGDDGTRLVFRPGLQTRYDQVINGRWDQESMIAGTAPDIGNGGWIWPGRGMFRVQTREVATRYKDDWELASSLPMRKDLYEGSVNQHWVSGFKVAAAPDDPGFSARAGGTVVRLDAKADMTRFRPGGYVWVGAANSRKFYAQQGITEQSMIEALHMRQEMFRLSRMDATARTITLDRPLRWDLPVNSESDGSEPLNGNGTPYASKVTPLKVVEGVGFEDFSFTQDMNGLPKIGGQETYSLTPEQAVHNYGNLAPEYAMHGIVFKWAANSWARGLKATMTGSHPIVTEVARNLQIERNSFDGAWNKGKGGNGYLRGSRVWDSLWAHNLSRGLRHFTFQWSAGGNVAFRNDLDSDLNLHGGWEHDNLFEQNTVRVPYEHRSASCSANCGGEGGEMDAGTWYPIWWAAGPKAGKWAGSSGPQNVFYGNTLSKQTTAGGPFEPYRPYGAQAGTAFQFGSDGSDPRAFLPLSQDGQAITDWTGRETLNYQGNGVAALDVGHRQSLFLRDTGGELPPRDPKLVEIKAATWNMAGASSPRQGDRYATALPALHTRESPPRENDLLALQETGYPTDRHYWGKDTIAQTDYVKRMRDGSTNAPPVEEIWLSRTSGGRGGGYLYWLNTNVDTGSGNPEKINLAVWTRRSVRRDEIFVVPGATRNGVHEGKSRPALGVNYCGVVYFTWHGAAAGGTDNVTMLRNIRSHMENAGPNGQPLPWVVLGDFNMEAYGQTGLLTALGDDSGQFDVLPSSGPTRPVTGRTIDYAVTQNGVTPALYRGYGFGTPMTDFEMSDHLPVEYDFSYLTEDPRCTTSQPARQAKAVPRTTQNLRSASSTRSPYPSGAGTRPGSSRLKTRTFARSEQSAHNFRFLAAGDHPGHYRVLHSLTRTYLGQESGLADAPAVLQGSDDGDSQLWRLLDMGDGTWILLNKATGQALTALDRADGEELVGRDLADEFDPDQRWFLQDAENEALDVDEIVTGAGSAMTVQDSDPEPGTPVALEPDSDDSAEEFMPVYADKTEGYYCYYLVHKGLYVNSTATNPGVGDGNLLTLNEFRPNDGGYMFCTPPADRHASQLTAVGQYDARGRFLNLGTAGPGLLALSTSYGLTWNWKAVAG